MLMKEPPIGAIHMGTRYARKCRMLTNVTRHRGSQSARKMTQHLYVNFRQVELDLRVTCAGSSPGRLGNFER